MNESECKLAAVPEPSTAGLPLVFAAFCQIDRIGRNRELVNEVSGWSNNGGGVPALAEFQAVLAYVTQLQIPGDFSFSTENVSLENVLLTPMPEPSSIALGLFSIAIFGSLAIRRIRRG